MRKATLPNMPLAICFNSNKRRYNYAYSQVKPLLSRTDSFAHRAAILTLISGNGFHLPQIVARSKSIRTKTISSIKRLSTLYRPTKQIGGLASC